MTRAQWAFTAGVVLLLGFVGYVVDSQAKHGENRAEVARLDAANKRLVSTLSASVLASAPILAENDALVPAVEEAIEDATETSDALVEESEAQQEVAAVVGGTFRSRLDTALVEGFDSVIVAERAVASTERQRADSAEETIVTISNGWRASQSALARTRIDLGLALMVVDSLSVSGDLKDAIIAYQDNPPFLVKVWNAIPEYGAGVATVAGVLCILKC